MSDAMSTTSYAVLGMLGIQPWKPYELTQQMLRSLGYCWPISERALYNEPERLVRLGYASKRLDDGGRRSTGTYTITRAGRRALEDWLGTTPAPPRVFNEALLRVLLADQGDLASLRSSLESFRDTIVADHVGAAARMAEYVDGDGRFPHRAHLVAAFADLVDRLFGAFETWSEDLLADVEHWEDTRDRGLDDRARARLQAILDRAAELDGPDAR